MPYADRFRIENKWDIFTPDPKSQQVILRESYAVNWLDKPFGVGKVMDPILHEQYETNDDKNPAWYKIKSHEYVGGL